MPAFPDSTAAPILLGDIGGTNARFMLAPVAGPLPPPVVVRTADYPTLGVALQMILGKTVPRAGAFSVAGPVRDGVVSMTNCPWIVSTAEICATSGVAAPILINDFAALAQGLPMVGAGDVRPVGPGNILAAKGPIGVLGPGTGLGVSGLIPDGHGSYIPLAGEGGHVDLAPTNPRELAVIAYLLGQRAHVSAERILSGSGLALLHASLAAIDKVPAPLLSAPEIDAAALAGDPRALETIALFTGFLGAVAGNLALTLGATGGIYLGGGILPRWGALFDAQLFRAHFEAKGRFAAYLKKIPTAIITAPDVAFRGLRRLALETLGEPR